MKKLLTVLSVFLSLVGVLRASTSDQNAWETAYDQWLSVLAPSTMTAAAPSIRQWMALNPIDKYAAADDWWWALLQKWGGTWPLCYYVGGMNNRFPYDDLWRGPYPGNKVVNVAPGTNTLDAAVAAHPNGHTTYMLSTGDYYTDGGPGDGTGTVYGDYSQVVGKGAGVTRVHVTGDNIAFNGGTFWNSTLAEHILVEGVTIDCGVTGAAFASQGSYQVLQACVINNYASTAAGYEDFLVYMGSGVNAVGQVSKHNHVVNCVFTPAASGNVGGITVVQFGAPTTAGTMIYYIDHSIDRCTFSEPTDPATAYYQCVGQANWAGYNYFIAPHFSTGAFWFSEPGSWGSLDFQNDRGSTYTLAGNHVTLSPNFQLAADANHPNGALGTFRLLCNIVSNGETFLFAAVDAYPPNPAIVGINCSYNFVSSSNPTIDLAGSSSGTIGSITNVGNVPNQP